MAIIQRNQFGGKKPDSIYYDAAGQPHGQLTNLEAAELIIDNLQRALTEALEQNTGMRALLDDRRVCQCR